MNLEVNVINNTDIQEIKDKFKKLYAKQAPCELEFTNANTSQKSFEKFHWDVLIKLRATLIQSTTALYLKLRSYF